MARVPPPESYILVNKFITFLRFSEFDLIFLGFIIIFKGTSGGKFLGVMSLCTVICVYSAVFIIFMYNICKNLIWSLILSLIAFCFLFSDWLRTYVHHQRFINKFYLENFNVCWTDKSPKPARNTNKKKKCLLRLDKISDVFRPITFSLIKYYSKYSVIERKRYC